MPPLRLFNPIKFALYPKVPTACKCVNKEIREIEISTMGSMLYVIDISASF